jgi:hypothetical protein
VTGMSAIEVCRTAALGGHMERCDECGHERNASSLERETVFERASWVRGIHGSAKVAPLRLCTVVSCWNYCNRF